MEEETRLAGCSKIYLVGNIGEGDGVPENSDIERTKYNKIGIQNQRDVHHTRRISPTSSTPTTTRATHMGSNLAGQNMVENSFLSVDNPVW